MIQSTTPRPRGGNKFDYLEAVKQELGSEKFEQWKNERLQERELRRDYQRSSVLSRPYSVYATEMIVAEKFKAKGMSVIFMPENWPEYDLLVLTKEGWQRVQVKSRVSDSHTARLFQYKDIEKFLGVYYDIFVAVDNDGSTYQFTKFNRIANLSKHYKKKFNAWANDVDVSHIIAASKFQDRPKLSWAVRQLSISEVPFDQPLPTPSAARKRRVEKKKAIKNLYLTIE